MIEFIYNKYKQLMMHVAYKNLWDNELSEDAVQESFIKIIKNIKEIEGYEPSRMKNTVCLIARNISIDMLRKQKNDVSLEEHTDLIDSLDMEQHVIHKIEIQEILNVINTFPSEDREVLILNLFYGYEPHEIAQLTGWSDTKTRKRLQRAKEKIKKSHYTID